MSLPTPEEEQTQSEVAKEPSPPTDAVEERQETSPSAAGPRDDQGFSPVPPEESGRPEAESLPAETVEEDPGESPLRRRLHQRFHAWIDEVLSDEPPPAGIPDDILTGPGQDTGGSAEEDSLDPIDLYSLWSAMIALTQETKLQGRAFKQLSETLGQSEDLRGAVTSMLEIREQLISATREITDEVGRAREEAQQALRQKAVLAAQQELLDTMLDMRDRLVRGLAAARGCDEPGATGRQGLARLAAELFGRRRTSLAVDALIDGYTLALDRLEDQLERLGVAEISCLLGPFDPQRMIAVDTDESDDLPDGTVAEVYRTGYQWHGQVHRHAEVKVVRRDRRE